MQSTPLHQFVWTVLVLTSPIFLTPAFAAGPGSDYFANATELTGTQDTGNTTNLRNFTRQNFEPGHLPGGRHGASRSAWWKWTAPANGFCTVDTLLDSGEQAVIDTVLAVYTGSSISGLTAVVKNDDASIPGLPGTRLSSATFRAQEGVTYHVAVDGYDAASINSSRHLVTLRLRAFFPRATTFHGLHSFDADPAATGLTQVNLTKRGAISVVTRQGGRTLRSRGVAGSDGLFWTVLPRAANEADLPAQTLVLSLAGQPLLQLHDPVKGSHASKTLHEQRRFSPGNPNPFRGRFNYVLALPKGVDLEACGPGSCYVSATGRVRSACRAPDGLPVTWSAVLCDTPSKLQRAAFLMYQPTFRGRGFLTGECMFSLANSEPVLDSDHCIYLRPPGVSGSYYPDGILLTHVMRGGPFQMPAGLRFLMRLYATPDEGIATNIDERVQFTPPGRFEFGDPESRRPRLRLNPFNGHVSGSLVEPDTVRRQARAVVFRYQGVVLIAGQLSGIARTVPMAVVP